MVVTQKQHAQILKLHRHAHAPKQLCLLADGNILTQETLSERRKLRENAHRASSLTLVHCILEVTGSNMTETVYPESDDPGFPQSLQPIGQKVLQIRP